MRKAEKISEAIGNIDDKLITEAVNYHQNLKRRTHKSLFIRWIALTASLMLVAGGVFYGSVWMNSRRGKSGVGKSGDAEALFQETRAKEGTEEKIAWDTDDFFQKATLDTADEVEIDIGDKEEAVTFNYWISAEVDYEKKAMEQQADTALLEVYKNQLWQFYQLMIPLVLGDTGEQNQVYSPTQLYLSVGALAEVTGESNRQQLLSLLGMEDTEDLDELVQALWLSGYKNTDAIHSQFANSLWVSKDYAVKEDACALLADQYLTSVYNGGMGTDVLGYYVREWLKEQNDGFSSEQVEDISLGEEVQLAVLSTVTYQARWQDVVQSTDVISDRFYGYNKTTNCEWMRQEGDFVFYTGTHFRGVSLPLPEGDSIWLFLPDEDTSVEELLLESFGEMAQLLQEEETWEGQREAGTQVLIPKFEIASELDLKTALQDCAVTDIFSWERADFSGLTDDQVCLTELVQVLDFGVSGQEFLNVPIEGEAEEQVISVEESTGTELKMNRPFFVTVTNAQHVPVLAGVVYEPTQQ
ncbi:MAG: hypothetical protein IJV50_02545 [Lachnospiraceae bacterium]|nr:hypothetical protein [Lachnospiraceae bacterium]